MYFSSYTKILIWVALEEEERKKNMTGDDVTGHFNLTWNTLIYLLTKAVVKHENNSFKFIVNGNTGIFILFFVPFCIFFISLKYDMYQLLSLIIN